MTYQYTGVIVRQECAEAGEVLTEQRLTEGQALLIVVANGKQTISTLSATDPALASLALTQVAERDEGT